MDAKTVELYNQLTESLEEIVKVYRHLLDIVRKEKDILVATRLDDLNENNRAKEAMLIKIRAMDVQRQKQAEDLCQHLGLNPAEPRLLEIARHLQGESGERLRNLHSVLDLLLKRVREFNQQNEVLVNTALQNITGAMSALRDGLKDKPTYQRKGEVSSQPASSGQLVSREA